MRILLTIFILTLSANAWATDIPDADSPAAKIFVSRCSACHDLPHPKRLDWTHWRHILGLMKMRMDERKVMMSDADWRQVSAYLKQHAN